MCGTSKFYSNKISFYAGLDVKKEKSVQASNGSPCKEGYMSSDVHTEDNINKGSSLQHPFWHPCTNDLNFLVRLHHGSWKTFDIVALPRIHYYLTLRDY